MTKCKSCGASVYGDAADCRLNEAGVLVDTVETINGYVAHHPTVYVSITTGAAYPTRAQAAAAYAIEALNLQPMVSTSGWEPVRVLKVRGSRYHVRRVNV